MLFSLSLSRCSCLCLLVVVACCQVSVLPIVSSSPPSSPHADTVTVVVDRTIISPPIAPNFVGFSLEWDIATSWTGRGRVRDSFVSLINQLSVTADQRAGPVFRIGGNSADYSWYNPNGQPIPHPPGSDIVYNITDVDITSLAAGMPRVRGSLILGVNFLRPDNASWAVSHLQAVDRLVGWTNGVIKGVEIGNECDAYHATRPDGYNETMYEQEWSYYVQQVRQAIPRMPKKLWQGAAFCCDNWVPDLPGLVSRLAPDLISVSIHHYPYCDCGTAGITLADLLSDSASAKEAQYVDGLQVVPQVNAYDLPLLIGEGNSVCCSGKKNTSNVAGSALWVVDELFHVARIGISNWYFHSHDRNISHYQPLIWQSDTDDTPTVNPEYYALRFFALATRDYAMMIQANVSSTTNPMVKVWATITPTQIHIICLHKNLNSTSATSVLLDMRQALSNPPYPDGHLIRYESRYGPYATYEGISLAGQTYAGSRTGEPIGTWVEETVTGNNGVYTFDIQPISMVLISFSRATATADE